MNAQTPAAVDPTKPRINALSLQLNTRIANNICTTISSVCGAAVGIIGLTGWWGFGSYLFSVLLFSLLVLLKADKAPSNFFVSWFWMDGFTTGMGTYLLFWVMLYGLVHVY